MNEPNFPSYWDEYVGEDRIDYFFNNRISVIRDVRHDENIHHDIPIRREFYILTNGSYYGYTTVEVMKSLFSRLGLAGFFDDSN